MSTIVIVKENAVEEIQRMAKGQVLNALSSLNTWTGIETYLDGIPSRWLKLPVKKVLKTEISLANEINKIKTILMLKLEECLLKADVKELKAIIKRTNENFENRILFKNEINSFEACYINKGEYEVEDDNGEKMVFGADVILETIKDIKEDIISNNIEMEKSKSETKALARILRRKFI